MYLVALLICGAALMLFGSSGFDSDTKVDGALTLEEQTERICSAIDGVGDCTVMITYGEDEEVYAVAVLCDGAESLKVKSAVTELASSLFGIGVNRISVLKKSK